MTLASKSKANAGTEPLIPNSICTLPSERKRHDYDRNETMAINDCVVADNRSILQSDYGIELLAADIV